MKPVRLGDQNYAVGNLNSLFVGNLYEDFELKKILDQHSMFASGANVRNLL